MTVHTVNTEAGRLSGDHTDGVARFLGVPYAAAPVGERRFAAPDPPERWTGTRNTTGYGATAPQPALHPAHAALAPLIGPGWVTGDGDYLNLNVWTPDPGTSGLPVMVYVHGGGFMIGSGAAPPSTVPRSRATASSWSPSTTDSGQRASSHCPVGPRTSDCAIRSQHCAGCATTSSGSAGTRTTSPSSANRLAAPRSRSCCAPRWPPDCSGERSSRADTSTT
jgi:hypothetical protein